MKDANAKWKSPLLFTDEKGYKFYLEVYPSGWGSGEDTHISVNVSLIGDYDSDVASVFERDVVIELLNWRADKNHLLASVNFSRNSNNNGSASCSSSSSHENAPGTTGTPHFISYSSLSNPDTNTEYLQDDCLRLRVVDVAVYSTSLLSKMPSWQDPHTATQSVCEFTLTEFTRRKHLNNVYTIPFYTHPNGYKLYLKVNANGVGKTKGIHIRIGAKLMRGDFDSDLQWPFEGDIIVELLNWREDNHHYRGDAICFMKHKDLYGNANSRVTKGECSLKGWFTNSITHSSLLYNPDTNTEYLQDDCLRVRVVDIAIYSTPLLLKTPSWQDPHTATKSVCEFTLTEFTKRKQFNNVYYSPPFYSHPNGYKLCLRVVANGSGKGKGTHISIYAILMKGDDDNNLQWPFEGDIVIELLNWRENNNHYNCGDTIDLNKHNDSDGSITSRVTEGEYACKVWGILRFISHSSLLYNPDTNTEYLQDDCLRLRVVDVAVYSTPLLLKTPSWQDPHTATQSVCEFTLTEFTKRKQFNNEYCSQSFYSHPNGYKLCLRVDANGSGNGKGTHVSIFASLMKGDYDNNLQWPFEGDIVVELLNWRENNNHYCGDTFCLNKNYDSDGRLTSRVTEGEYALLRVGHTSFITHSSLFYNPDTNTEYLQDDCLHLRVVDVAVYSTPLLSKTPSWQDPHTATQSVCEFTLTEFTKRKQFNNDYHSQAFYSHPHGYKLCLRVFANSYGKGKGTHISIDARLMKGDYDNSLQWPFEGEIVVKLLNWREDNRHYQGDLIKLSRHGGSATSRVTEGEYAPKSNGILCFISHSSLFYNPDTNTEYLQDDCLRLRVANIAIFNNLSV